MFGISFGWILQVGVERNDVIAARTYQDPLRLQPGGPHYSSQPNDTQLRPLATVALQQCWRKVYAAVINSDDLIHHT